jgi:hypothetical protein
MRTEYRRTMLDMVDRPPAKKTARIPIFSGLGLWMCQTVESGRARMMRSVTIVKTLVAGRVSGRYLF